MGPLCKQKNKNSKLNKLEVGWGYNTMKKLNVTPACRYPVGHLTGVNYSIWCNFKWNIGLWSTKKHLLRVPTLKNIFYFNFGKILILNDYYKIKRNFCIEPLPTLSFLIPPPPPPKHLTCVRQELGTSFMSRSCHVAQIFAESCSRTLTRVILRWESFFKR